MDLTKKSLLNSIEINTEFVGEKFIKKFGHQSKSHYIVRNVINGFTSMNLVIAKGTDKCL